MTKKEEFKGTFEGARKVALLLSMVDPKTADALLAQFEPGVVEEIVREAKNIKDAPPEDFEAVVSEFLRSTEGGKKDGEFSQTPRKNESNVPTPKDVARILRNERPLIGAVVLSGMSSRERLQTSALLSQEQVDGTRRLASVWVESTSVSEELEEAFIRRALQNER